MKKRLSIVFAILLVLTSIVPVFAADMGQVDQAIEKNGQFMKETVPNPQFGTMAGEWTVLSLARSGLDLEDSYIENYYRHIESTVAQKEGKLTRNKFTEYSRLIVALTAIDKDVENVGGYNLLAPLADFKDVIKQGINGPIWALIAFDTKNFDIPKADNPEHQNSRERMIQEILDREVVDDNGVRGGWSLMGDKPDPDITAMSLYALWPYYRTDERVRAASDRAIKILSDLQLSTGGYMTMGDENLESSAQVAIALATMGIDPMEDPRFIKTDEAGNRHSVVDAILEYELPNGGYVHVKDQSSADAMSTDQAMEALVAIKRFKEGKPALFDMADVGNVVPLGPSGYIDIGDSWAKDLIVETDGYNLVVNSNLFKPELPANREEFAQAMVNGLDIELASNVVEFEDVAANSPYKKAIDIASSNGIIEGRDTGEFDPKANITREEAMAIIERSLKVKGVDTAIDESKINEILASFSDGAEVSNWAKVYVAFTIDRGIVQGRVEGIAPKGNITRAETVKIVDNASQVN